MISGKETASAVIYSNTAALAAFADISTAPLGPAAKDATETAVANNLKWEIVNLSYIDLDTNEEFIEITNTLTMPILATDDITFHVEFTSDNSDLNGANLFRDAFECRLTRDVATGYWDVVATDYYVRGTAETAPVADFNNSVENDGRDWFVFEKDADREDNLCTSSAEAGF